MAGAAKTVIRKKYCRTALVYFFTTCTALNKILFTPQPKIIKFKLSNQTKEIKMAKAKIGDRIVINGFAGDEPSADKYIGKTGIVESIDDIGIIHGTWGGLGLLPEDDYEVLAES